MSELKIPQAWTASTKKVAAVTAASGKKVTARIDMSAEVAGKGLCPDCRKPMSISHAAGHEVLACNPCRIVIPTKDADEPVPQEAETVTVNY